MTAPDSTIADVSSDMVERVGDALGVVFYGRYGWRKWGAISVYADQMRALAEAALEASCHAELVEALITARAYIAERADDSHSNREVCLLAGIDALLAKLGDGK